MFQIKHTVLLIVLFIAIKGFASELPPKYKHKPKGHGYRVNFGTGLSFYNLNEKHGSNPRQRMNGTIGFRRELRVVNDYKTFLLFGIDYVFHGIRYQSYFFKPDSLKLYNRKYDYEYTLTMNEIHIPIQMKYLLRRSDNSLFSPYFLIGYHFRYLLPGILNVSQNGKTFANERANMLFRTHLLNKKVNASLCLSAGWQINRIGNSRGSFFAEINLQYGFSDYYFEKDYSAANMFINCTQAILLVGAKF